MILDAEDLHAMLEAVTDFTVEQLEPHAITWDEEKHFPVDVLRRGGDLGLGGIWVADDVGGAGLGRAEAVRIFEELSRGCPAVAAYISIHNMVASMIDKAGTPEQRRRWVPSLTSMTTLASYCLTEPDAGSDAAALRTSARRDGDEYVLDGVKQFISGAGATDLYVVMARTGGPGAGGVSAFVIEKDTPGLSFGANERKMGWNAQPTRQVIMEGVRVPADHRLGDEGTGFKLAMTGLNGGRLNIAACSLGGAAWALDRAVAHLHDRTAFGAPLAERESLVFKVADATTRLAAARALLHRAADALDAAEPDAATTCAMAKQFVTDTGYEVANTALQLHGGYGYLREYGVEKVVRDLRVHHILVGTTQNRNLIVGRAVIGGRR